MLHVLRLRSATNPITKDNGCTPLSLRKCPITWMVFGAIEPKTLQSPDNVFLLKIAKFTRLGGWHSSTRNATATA